MKKLLMTGLVMTGLSVGLYSCNNGAYTANPDKTNGLNPLDPKSGVTVYLGSYETFINGYSYLFAPCTYSIDTAGNRIIHGRVKDDSIFVREVTITFKSDKYKGVYNYEIGGNDSLDNNNPFTGISFEYSFYDTTLHFYRYYKSDVSDGKGIIHMSVKGQESDNMRGTITGTTFRKLPEDLTGADSAVFTKGEFYVPKKK